MGTIESVTDGNAGGSAARGQKKFCPDSGMLSTDGLESRTTGTILQMLLRPLAAITLVGSAALLARGLSVEPAAVNSVHYIATAVLAAVTAWLFLRPAMSLPTLRFIELALIAAAAVQMAVANYDKLLAAAATGDAGHVATALSVGLLGFTILMGAYAIFIPNTWARASIVIVALSLATPLTWWVAVSRHPEIRILATPISSGRTVPDLALLTLIAVAVCTMGTMLIGRYRRTAFEARTSNLYDLRHLIGAGGMGEVWMAEHKTLARPAAIKIVRPDLLADGDKAAGTRVVKRFALEAKATATLRSPHTVEIYDFGVTEQGVFYYVMEYLDGLDLGTLVERHGPLPAPRAIHLVRQICASLEDAHAHSLVHRDIKPANLFACRMGTEYDFIKVLDFGLVKDQRPTEQTQLTVEGLTTGTPAYMPPEMALQSGSVGPAIDVYALGCVAYWLLTGKLVFDEPTPVAMIVNHVKTAPPAPSTRTEMQISPELDAVILRCLEKDPGARYPTMRALSEALAAVDPGPVWDTDQAREWWDVHQPAETVEDKRRAS
jgi:serine/threonine-protein kinase